MNTSTRSCRVLFFILMACSHANAAPSVDKPGHQVEEEIIVSAPFRRNSAETALPVNALSGEALRQVVESSLGETLNGEAGVHNASFGTGVGQAVIRGQSGNRVQVLQNHVNNVDVASVSPDHANGVEPALARSIEVIRGPATLLYGNGAIGGIVNVLDERIPESRFDEPELVFEQSHNAVNDENKRIGSAGFSIGVLNVHMDATERDANDTEIPGFAIDEAALDEEAHDDHADHGEEEPENTRGFIENSSSDATSHTLGMSVSGRQGFIGISFNRLKSEYGLPPGVHAHHEEEGHAAGEDEEEAPIIRLDMDQRRQDLGFEYRFSDSWVDSIRGAINRTRYEHTELEIEDGVTSTGTRFENEGIESRFTLTHRPVAGWTGVFGLQLSDGEFSATGDESFIPQTDNASIALFGVESIDVASLTFELGFRIEDLELGTDFDCDRDERTASFSASMLAAVGDGKTALVALSRSERAPTLEERFSNIRPDSCTAPGVEDLVLHAATSRFETGDPDLDPETASNIELGWRQVSGEWEAELNIYYNRIDDYIYLEDTGIFRDESPVARYLAKDATFTGFEASVERHLLEGEDEALSLSLTADYVRGRFDDGGDIPRIPPARLGTHLSWYRGNWSADLRVTRVFEQDRTAPGESASNAYTLVSAHLDYHIGAGKGELLLFLRAENLLDEEIRLHTSLLKNFAPEPGRAIRAGIRYTL